MFKFIEQYIATLVITPILIVWFLVIITKDLLVRLLTWNTADVTLEEKLVNVDKLSLSLKDLIKNGETK